MKWRKHEKVEAIFIVVIEEIVKVKAKKKAKNFYGPGPRGIYIA